METRLGYVVCLSAMNMAFIGQTLNSVSPSGIAITLFILNGVLGALNFWKALED